MALRSNASDLLRQPVVQFAVIGALLAVLFGVTGGGAGDAEREGTITMTAPAAAALRRRWPEMAGKRLRVHVRFVR